MKKLMIASMVMFLALSGVAQAYNALQLDIAGGTYDLTTETIVSSGSSFNLYAYLMAGDKDNFLSDTYYLSAAIVPKTGPAGSALGSFSVNGISYNVTSDLIYGTPPLEAALATTDPNDLASHGIYETYFKEIAFSFTSGNQISPYNTQDRALNGSIPSNKVKISGVNVHFVEAGKGPPILFLHGLGGAWRDWSANLPAFAATYRVISVDFPGFGESDKPEVHYSIEWLTDVVEKFLQEQEIDRVTLVGHSMGGVVALNLASRPKSRVKKLVITDAVGIGDKSEFLGYAMSKQIWGQTPSGNLWKASSKINSGPWPTICIEQQKPQTVRDFFESLENAHHRETSSAHDSEGANDPQHHGF